MRSEMMEEDRVALHAAIETALPDDVMAPLKKKARDLADSIVDDIEYSLKDNLASNLSYHVREMAERAVNALLAGNHGEMVRWLSCDKRGYTGRYDAEGFGRRSVEEQHPIIHGALHENGAVALRHKIVDAHRDMLVNERILDLEDQVKSLVEQVNKANREKQEILERARSGEFA
ncbi:MAG: hypothetical protein E6Q97_13140 [Desulfurellales bacterium]|nr:MAG: hypothetical protein E6Q97_13140 [Desulfurellales bacterium]